jgi:hypothetical protein
MGFLSDDGGENYNACHCAYRYRPIEILVHLILVWSNFEIGDLDFWRGEAYSKYFEYLDSKGGFYYEVRILLCLCPTKRTLICCLALGRCSCTQCWRVASCQEGSDTFLQ